MKIVEISKAVSAPGKNCYGTCTIDVSLSKFDRIQVQHSTKKDQDGEWEKDNISNTTVAEIAGWGDVRLSGEVRENDKGDVFFSVKHVRLDWESAVMLGIEGLRAIESIAPPARPTKARTTVPDNDNPI